jgi:hypothetical protein
MEGGLPRAMASAVIDELEEDAMDAHQERLAALWVFS